MCGSQENTINFEEKLLFHLISNTVATQKKWLANMAFLKSDVNDNTGFVCSKHFETSCYEEHLGSMIALQSPRKNYLSVIVCQQYSTMKIAHLSQMEHVLVKILARLEFSKLSQPGVIAMLE